MRVAILGAGGVGGYYGGVLAAPGTRSSMLARGPHLDAIRARGIEVRTPEGTFTAPSGRPTIPTPWAVPSTPSSP